MQTSKVSVETQTSEDLFDAFIQEKENELKKAKEFEENQDSNGDNSKRAKGRKSKETTPGMKKL